MRPIKEKFSDSGIVIKVISDKYYSGENITPSALTSLTLAFKGFFRTYNTLHSFNYNLTNFSDIQEEELCEFSEYHENYMQTIIHFHHFIELLMKDALRFNNEKLANKIKKNTGSEGKLNQYLSEGKEIDEIEFTDMTVEYNTSMNRILALPSNTFKEIITRHKDTIEEINLLRNKLLHRGAFFLPYRKLDEFIIKMILPLVEDVLYKCEGLWDGEELKEYWCYDTETSTDIDPIEGLINMSKERKIDHKAIAFYKAVGLALYQRPVGSIIKRFYEEDLMRQIYDIQSKSNKSCFVCSYDTLFLYPDINYNSPHELNKGENSFKTGKAVCTNCGLKLYNDVSEPAEYGISEDVGIIWGYTHFIDII